jgi:homoserine kinase type II
MNHVYLLQHSYENECGEDECKTIGIYASEDEANQAVERLKKQPGFSVLPDHFIVSKYEINKDHWSEGFSSGKYIRKFCVWCQDVNGGISIVSSGHSETEALREVRQFSKQKSGNQYFAKEQF